jgi:molecular chaperone DnaJ
VRLRIRPQTQPGQEIRVRGHGLPRPRGAGRGDLLVSVRVVLPALDDEARADFARFAEAHPQPSPRGGGRARTTSTVH